MRKDDLAGDAARARYDARYELAKVGKPVDPEDQAHDAADDQRTTTRSGTRSSFPAAILQPPFDMAADDAVNYGAIGAVIGHEMGHGFDDQGRRFDAKGALRDQWTAKDGEEFQRRATRRWPTTSASRLYLERR
ncbi:MAG: M13-type metalloendopeptidase [Candidatus Binatia bacterium]